MPLGVTRIVLACSSRPVQEVPMARSRKNIIGKAQDEGLVVVRERWFVLALLVLILAIAIVVKW